MAVVVDSTKGFFYSPFARLALPEIYQRGTGVSEEEDLGLLEVLSKDYRGANPQLWYVAVVLYDIKGFFECPFVHLTLAEIKDRGTGSPESKS